MPFCKKGMPAIRKIVDIVTEKLEDITDEVMKYTKLIKDLEANPAVEAIIKLIPGGTKVQGWLDTAIDEYTGIKDSTLSFAEKLKEWLDAQPTEAAKNAAVFKLASLAIKAGDLEDGDEPKKESIYDSAVQLAVMTA